MCAIYWGSDVLGFCFLMGGGGGGIHVLVGRSQRAAAGSFTIWVPRIKLKWLGFAASTFTY